MRILKLLSFGIFTALIVILAVLSSVVKAGIPSDIYSSWWMVALWGLLVASSIVYVIRKRLYRRTAVFMIHSSFVIILAGALSTHCLSDSGELCLSVGLSTDVYDTDAGAREMPFAVRLVDFNLETYPGTSTPRDFVSRVEVVEPDVAAVEATVSMNKIFEYRGYRFYQAKYDPVNEIVTLSVYRDPVGISVTYAGYLLFAVSCGLFFFSRSSRFRRALGKVASKTAIGAGMLLVAMPAGATVAQDDLLPPYVAARLGELPVFYNDRIAPVSTMARDFTAGLCGSASYRGIDAEQVFGGFLFDFGSWKDEPLIKVKDPELRSIIGIDGKRASYEDFFRAVTSGRLDVDDLEVQRRFAKDIAKFESINMLVSGSLMKLFPIVDSVACSVTWYSPVDRLPFEIDDGKWLFVRKFLGYVNEKLRMRDYDEVLALFDKLETYQDKETASAIPPKWIRKTEMAYNRICRVNYIGIACLLAGMVAFFAFCTASGPGRRFRRAGIAVIAVAWVAVSALIVMRWIVCSHVPLSNGFETMQFMSWCALSVALAVSRRLTMVIPFGLIVAGLTLLVASMSGAGSSVTPLMPVLASPLLSIHVAVIMISYSLFAFMMLNGVMALIVGRRPGGCDRMAHLAEIGRVMLYPAVFLLAVGIFIGAVWANVSWGRYWGWDPKEVWALITMMIYSLALHSSSLRWFEHPARFHLFCIMAFISVVVTYFGVNFFLGGLHSYA